MKQRIIERIYKEKLIVIVRGVEESKLIPLSEALYRGGIRLLELTYSANGSIPDEETAHRIHLLCHHWGDRMEIGAGTVLTERQVELTKEAGGGFIISPDTNVDVIRHTCELGLVSIPGALTPSEITAAHRAGADFVKLFPVTDFGTSYIKNVRAPLSHIPMLAVGGITVENAKEYLQAGACGLGIGSSITNKQMLASNDFDGIAALASAFCEAVKA